MTTAGSACCNRAVRLLLIEEDVRRCAHIQQRLISWRPHAELVVHRPVTQGALAREFLASSHVELVHFHVRPAPLLLRNAL